MAKTKLRLRRSEIPKVTELWMLWNVDANIWAIACDDPSKSTAYLCSTSREAAIDLAEHQKEYYEIVSVPVRVI